MKTIHKRKLGKNRKSTKRRTIRHKKSSNKTSKRIGGKTFSSNKPVYLHYNNEKVVCYVCGHDTYTETIGSINKSKVRSGVGQFFFGELADVVDNTSIIMYTCNHCGFSKTIRNKDPLLIMASDVVPPLQ